MSAAAITMIPLARRAREAADGATTTMTASSAPMLGTVPMAPAITTLTGRATSRPTARGMMTITRTGLGRMVRTAMVSRMAHLGTAVMMKDVEAAMAAATTTKEEVPR